MALAPHAAPPTHPQPMCISTYVCTYEHVIYNCKTKYQSYLHTNGPWKHSNCYKLPSYSMYSTREKNFIVILLLQYDKSLVSDGS